MVRNQDGHTIKARAYYIDVVPERAGDPTELLRVTGFTKVDTETWCRVRFLGDRKSSMLCHPNRLRPATEEEVRRAKIA